MLAGIDYDGSIIVGVEKNDYINRPCTVVVHDGDKHERVFTESEVRAMVNTMIADAKYKQEWSAIDTIVDVVHRNGIVLDPA